MKWMRPTDNVRQSAKCNALHVRTTAGLSGKSAHNIGVRATLPPDVRYLHKVRELTFFAIQVKSQSEASFCLFRHVIFVRGLSLLRVDAVVQYAKDMFVRTFRAVEVEVVGFGGRALKLAVYYVR